MDSLYGKLAATLAAIALVALAAFGTADRLGADYTDQSFRRALVTFAAARGLNAVISVAQGTEIAVEPAGVGVNFTPGQVLDPINDLVERFSWVMLTSATALGIQKLMLEIFSARVFTMILGITTALALLTLWLPRATPWLRSALLRAALFLLVLRFMVPLIAFGSELLYSAFLQERYTESAARLEHVTENIRQVNEGTQPPAPAATDDSVVGRVRKLYDSALGAVDVRTYVERYRQAAADVSEQVINLMVVFLVQTVVLPLLFLWLVMRGVRRIWHMPRLPDAG